MSFKAVLHIHRVIRPLLLLATTLLCFSCGPDALTGRVVLSGSSTLSPLASKAVEQWKHKHPRIDTRVEAIGSDAGLERLIRFDDADLALLSRPLAERDLEAARAVGKELVALPLAWDAVSLVVPSSNHWAASLTRDQAVRAFTTARLWSDLDPSWPASPVHRFVLGPNSGTVDVFAATLLGGSKAALYAGPDTQSSEDDAILARGVSQVDGALGFLGWTTIQQSGLALRVVALDGISPSESTIRSGAYGLPRQLWLVVTRATWKSHEGVRSFVHYVYEHYADVVRGSPLVPLGDGELAGVERLLKASL